MSIKPSTEGTDALEWFKSSYSTSEGPDCVEVAGSPGAVHVRDSKNKQGPRLTFAGQGWADFVSFAAERR